MEITIKSLITLGAILFTGLSAGLFYAWSVSVIPGNEKVNYTTYLETMQSINRAILNPAFFAVFFGSAILLTTSTIYSLNVSKLSFGLMLAATLFYVAGTVAVTGLGNVPLNNQLDALNLADLSASKAEEFRQFYESKWNLLHRIRTGNAIIAFILALLSVFSQLKP